MYKDPAPAAPPAATAPPKEYVCLRVARAPVIDGELDDPAWQEAPWSDDFVDIEGPTKPAPRFRTRMKMACDDAALYVAAELEEPELCATLTKHDSVIFHDDDFELFLDPDGDRDVYGELELNEFDTTWDLLLTKPYRDGGLPINGWEIAGLKTAVALHGTVNDPRDVDRGWSVEMALPWPALTELMHDGRPPRDGDRWRIDFSRVEWRKEVAADGTYRRSPGAREDNWVWSPQGVVDMHRPERWGFVRFATPYGVRVTTMPRCAEPLLLPEVRTRIELLPTTSSIDGVWK